jgi:hypothetical protein
LAHKRCAELSKTSRFVVIDGDNILKSEFITFELPPEIVEKDYVLSWSSRNSINGLSYGNGGVKCWPKDLALSMKSHEESNQEEAEVDFCFIVDYFQFSESLSDTIINITPFQSFRAGYREGIKMSLDRGLKIDSPDEFLKRITKNNLTRLIAWCEIGRDVEHGLWALLGARLGCLEFAKGQVELKSIRDYNWFHSKWNNEIQKKFYSDEILDESKMEEYVCTLASDLKDYLGLEISEYNAEDSKNFKAEFKNPQRQGLMFPEGR